MPQSDCAHQLDYHSREAVETHGFETGPYEHVLYEWWVCTICGEWFTAEELEKLNEPK